MNASVKVGETYELLVVEFQDQSATKDFDDVKERADRGSSGTFYILNPSTGNPIGGNGPLKINGGEVTASLNFGDGIAQCTIAKGKRFMQLTVTSFK